MQDFWTINNTLISNVSSLVCAPRKLIGVSSQDGFGGAKLPSSDSSFWGRSNGGSDRQGKCVCGLWGGWRQLVRLDSLGGALSVFCEQFEYIIDGSIFWKNWMQPKSEQWSYWPSFVRSMFKRNDSIQYDDVLWKGFHWTSLQSCHVSYLLSSLVIPRWGFVAV